MKKVIFSQFFTTPCKALLHMAQGGRFIIMYL